MSFYLHFTFSFSRLVFSSRPCISIVLFIGNKLLNWYSNWPVVDSQWLLPKFETSSLCGSSSCFPWTLGVYESRPSFLVCSDLGGLSSPELQGYEWPGYTAAWSFCSLTVTFPPNKPLSFEIYDTSLHLFSTTFWILYWNYNRTYCDFWVSCRHCQGGWHIPWSSFKDIRLLNANNLDDIFPQPSA